MTLLPILLFALILLAAMGFYFLYGGRQEGKAEVRQRLSLLDVRRLRGEELPEVLKNELLSDVPALNEILSRWNFAVRIDKRLRQAGLDMKVGTFVLVTVTLAAAATVVGILRHWPLVLSLALGAAMAMVPNAVVNVKKRLRQKQFLSHFPDALEMFARSLRAGHSFTGAIQLVAQEMPSPIGPEFHKVFDEQNLGVPMRQALLGMSDRIDILDVKFFVTAVMIQRDTGGNLAEIIDKIAQVIRERFRIQGQLKTFTAQARMTGIILGGLPVGVAVLIGIINPEYIKPLFHERAGKIMLALAGTLQILGVLAIRRIIRIKI